MKDYLRRLLEFWIKKWKIRLRDTSLLISTENRIRIPIILMVLIFGLLVINQNVELPAIENAFLATILSVTEVILGVYISFELLFSTLKPFSKDRIDRPEEVIGFYEDYRDKDWTSQFINLNDIKGHDFSRAVPTYDDTSDNLPLPAIIHYAPEEPAPVSNINENIREEYYPFPDRIERIYQPVMDDLYDKFTSEGNFNQMKLRPEDFTEEEFTMGKTTFFNNFATNLIPDYNVYEHRTPRELFHPLIFDSNHQMKSLDDTDLPYIASAAGVLIGKNGEAIFPVRGRDVVIEGMNLGLSFGGSWDKDVVEEKGIDGQIFEELKQERFSEEMEEDIRDIAQIYYLGTVRRVELLGKPDCFVVAIAEDVPDWKYETREDTDVFVFDIVSGETEINDLSDLTENIEEINENILEVIEISPYPPGTGLLDWLYMLNKAAGNISERESS